MAYGLFLAAFVIALVATLIKGTVFKSTVPPDLCKVPGPSGLPIIGNALQLGKYPQKALRKWADEYGELFRIRLGYHEWVYLNSPMAVHSILDKQSAATSGRVPMPVLSGTVSDGKRFLLMGYTTEWRKLRSIVHRLLTPKASDAFKPSQLFESKQLLYDILTNNDDQASFYMHVRRYTTSVMLTSTYGRRVPVWECDDVREVYGLMKEFSESAEPGAFLADMYPPLAKLPVWLQWWRPRARRYYERQKTIWMKYWNTLKIQRELGIAPECFVKQWMETDQEKHGIDEVQAAFVAGSLYPKRSLPNKIEIVADSLAAMIEAGSETTSAALNTAIKYLAAFPESQKAAREELGRVIGDQRSPTFDDEDSLPYIRATVKEVLRIRPVTTIGSPHFTTSDIVYKGMLIPKNTVVSLGQYAIHYDEKRWANPEVFDPSRYLAYPLKAGAYAASGDPDGRDHFDFGAGRRICAGIHLAENSLFITLAKILWSFEIRPPLDVDDTEMEVDISDESYEEGGNTVPKPFKVRFIPVNAARQETLIQEWERAKREGFHLGGVRVDVDGVVIAKQC